MVTAGLTVLLLQVVANSEVYVKLTSNQLASMLAENTLKVNSEFRLFELVLRWLEADRLAKQQCFAGLMRNVRLPLLSGVELVEKVLMIVSITSCYIIIIARTFGYSLVELVMLDISWVVICRSKSFH